MFRLWHHVKLNYVDPVDKAKKTGKLTSDVKTVMKDCALYVPAIIKKNESTCNHKTIHIQTYKPPVFSIKTR